MGYDFHITRAEHWADSERTPITAAEWLALVAADPELTIDPRDNGPYFSLWLGHWTGADHPWLDWHRGEIFTKHPDRKTLSKLLGIAGQFGATVQGDEGEPNTRPKAFPERGGMAEEGRPTPPNPPTPSGLKTATMSLPTKPPANP